MVSINQLVITEFSESEPPVIILPTLQFLYSGKVEVKNLGNGYKIELPLSNNTEKDISDWENKKD